MEIFNLTIYLVFEGLNKKFINEIRANKKKRG